MALYIAVPGWQLANDERAIWATPTPLGFNSSASGLVLQCEAPPVMFVGLDSPQ